MAGAVLKNSFPMFRFRCAFVMHCRNVQFWTCGTGREQVAGLRHSVWHKFASVTDSEQHDPSTLIVSGMYIVLRTCLLSQLSSYTVHPPRKNAPGRSGTVCVGITCHEALTEFQARSASRLQSKRTVLSGSPNVVKRYYPTINDQTGTRCAEFNVEA